ncbi:MAG: hypothetical protein ACRDKJ_05275 [Actinomycetota bacterium]
MDIKITCRACERTIPLAMAIDPESRPGYCPLCGESLAFQYVDTFVETADRVLVMGKELVHQLIGLAELAGGFEIEKDSVVEPVNNALAIQDRLVAQPYEPRWPPRPSQPVP